MSIGVKNMGFGINPVEASEETITNDGFFPDVLVSDFQNVFHSINEVDFEKVKHALIHAMVYVNKSLKGLKNQSEYATLIESDLEKMGDISPKEINYQVAVFGHAKANLLPLLINVSQREKGEELQNNIEDLQHEYKKQSNQAIRELLDLNSGTVVLI